MENNFKKSATKIISDSDNNSLEHGKNLIETTEVRVSSSNIMNKFTEFEEKGFMDFDLSLINNPRVKDFILKLVLFGFEVSLGSVNTTITTVCYKRSLKYCINFSATSEIEDLVGSDGKDRVEEVFQEIVEKWKAALEIKEYLN